MFKKSVYALVVFLLLVLMLSSYISFQETKHIYRDPNTLMNQYYRLKESNPTAARQALLILLAQDSGYLPALKEVSHSYLHIQNIKAALPFLQRLHNRDPTKEEYTYQLAYAYYQNGEWSKAQELFLQLLQQSTGKMKQVAQQALTAMKSYLIFYEHAAKREPVQKPVIDRQPENKTARLRDDNTFAAKGYLAIKQHHPIDAIDYFLKSYALTHQPNEAMQLGYLYDQINQKPCAYQYFKLATRSTNQALALRAQNAMTNLSGLQTKAWPSPYFSEVIFNPFSQTRFGLTVRPLVVRFGVEQEQAIQTKEYFFLRRTDDNKSKNLGQISQIYEDDVEIFGVGGQITPIGRIPLVAFLETGFAYDLIYRNRKPWRGDLRAGLMYYNEFGARPIYVDKPVWSLHYYSDLYGEGTYFTRYNNNVIFGVKTHQGIRLLQYHSSMLNLYITGRTIADIQRQFFNNFAEIGPGIEWIPTNRLNIKFLLEHVNGAYLPAGATPNPYNQYYTNTLVQLLFYVKF